MSKLGKHFLKHDFSARADDKVIKVRRKFGLEGYGMFWILNEVMAENGDGRIPESSLEDVFFDNHIPTEKGASFIDFCVSIKLYRFDDGFLVSDRIIETLGRISQKSEAMRDNAKKRWSKEADNQEVSEGENAKALQLHSNGNADKIREDKIREESDVGNSKIPDPTFTTNTTLKDYTKSSLSGPIELLRFSNPPKKVELAARVLIKGDRGRCVKAAITFWYGIVLRTLSEEKIFSKTLSRANLWSWSEQFRLLIEKDGQDFEKLRKVMNFVLSHKPTNDGGFCWFDNVQSPSKMREKFAELYNKSLTTAPSRETGVSIKRGSNFD